jgi:RHS repeat-associated protein
VAGSGRQTLIPDIQGSIVASVDASTGALTKTGYQPFGENPSPSNGSFQYTAARFDPESSFYYMRTRMYRTDWGRFTQADVIGYAGGNNLYAYVGNDPLNLTDPLGLCDSAQCGKANPAFSLLGIGATAACAAAEPCGAIELGGVAIVAGAAIILNNQNQDKGAAPQAPGLPDSLIGQNAQPGGKRINTDLPGTNPSPEELFTSLGGGQSITLPDGTRVAPNGVRLRPDTGSGPRIDIPANGSKPHETIHFPGSGQ